MATELRDYESHYERLEVQPECTRSEIRWVQPGQHLTPTTWHAGT